jgi:hypothetical protein
VKNPPASLVRWLRESAHNLFFQPPHHQQRWGALVAASVLLVLVSVQLWPFLSGFRLTADDVRHHEVGMGGLGETWEYAKRVAEFGGRIGHFLSVPLMVLGALFAEDLVFRTFYTALHFLSLAVFAHYVTVVVRQNFTLLIFLFLVSIQPLDFFHLAPNAYPFNVSVPVSLMVLSRINAVQARQRGQKRTWLQFLWHAVGLVGCIYAGEYGLVFFLILVLFEIMLTPSPVPIGKSVQLLARRYRAEAFTFLAAASAYLSYRLAQGSGYDGNQLPENFEIRDFGRVIVGHNLGGTTLSSFLRNRNELGNFVASEGFPFWFSLAVVFISSAYLLFWIGRRHGYFTAATQKMSKVWFQIFPAAVLLSGIMIAPLAITDRHRSWCQSLETCVYLSSRFSFYFFGLAILSLVMMAWHFLIVVKAQPVAISVVFAITVGSLSALNFANNSFTSATMASYVLPWERAKVVACADYPLSYDSLALLIDPDRSVSMHSSRNGNEYWALYIQDQRSRGLECGRYQDLSDFSDGYDATLEEGIDFSRRGFPDFVLYVDGLSSVEQWGRWSDANVSETVTIQFRENLPKRFILSVDVYVFASSAGLPMSVLVGEQENTVTLPQGVGTIEIVVEAASSPTRVEFRPPSPKTPAELGLSDDQRRLSVGFSGLRILPVSE